MAWVFHLYATNTSFIVNRFRKARNFFFKNNCSACKQSFYGWLIYATKEPLLFYITGCIIYYMIESILLKAKPREEKILINIYLCL